MVHMLQLLIKAVQNTSQQKAKISGSHPVLCLPQSRLHFFQWIRSLARSANAGSWQLRIPTADRELLNHKENADELHETDLR